ncbi:transcriptional regulator with XRE-family HTH domain [Dysgonomonas sp. PFB1-18]|uniref:helix-turn-helix domain-containing protein n=1 Tax=unclassified Dysgonomonas TaxID=2630389 RepID=UPI002476EC60|nr:MULTISPECIES: helix-turn-helix transcriptional regulator [unclassified Dysgonomonas]MDH6308809.1 transcriptional regulator with XRE-family HTH domain [Dysgonomonas sp. PF1-14]MDH6338495.1 transcriptional regulator with XRE-family HTH domain [Dysgonomonas sp. PF1-16]MDH6380058.1 transcriptional regulator with XRE-family HTH domain [Dysgonomonas sp. PFB1-18]MDH6397323.1 transcriptional regulator with XRE-family HTH domain [Dysgonomonas sp. PF1-23]
MKDRIRQIMEHEQLTPSAFADKLQLGRAVVSHILNGRNNPSLDVVTRILSNMEYLNPDWLITGNGSMYKSGYDNKNVSGQQPSTTPVNSYQANQPDLFSQTAVSLPNDKPETEYRKEIVVEQPQIQPENTVNQTIVYQKAPERKVSKIIIYYTDNTFETFNADNKPL